MSDNTFNNSNGGSLSKNFLSHIDRVIKIDSDGYIVPLTNNAIDKLTIPYNKIKYGGSKIYSRLPIFLSLIMCLINICTGHNIIPIVIPIFLTVFGTLMFFYMAYINYKLLDDDDATDRLIEIALKAYNDSVTHHNEIFADSSDVMNYGSKEEFINNDRNGSYLYIFSLYTMIFSKRCAREFSILNMHVIIMSMCEEKTFLAIMQKHKRLLDNIKDTPV